MAEDEMLGRDKRPLKKGMKVVQDVKTRWNLTTIMLQRILYLWPAVEQYCLESKFGFLKLTSHEWKQVEYLIAVSRMLALCTTRISESKGATLHLVFALYNVCFKRLEAASRRLMVKKHPWKKVIKTALEAAQEKLCKYYVETVKPFSDVYGLAILLHLAMKNEYWTRSKGEWGDEDVEQYWEILHSVFWTYTKASPNGDEGTSRDAGSVSDLFDASSTQARPAVDEFEEYCAESKFPQH